MGLSGPLICVFVTFLGCLFVVNLVPWSNFGVIESTTGVDVNLVEETRKAVLSSERGGAHGHHLLLDHQLI